jgi:hypothetical protein
MAEQLSPAHVATIAGIQSNNQVAVLVRELQADHKQQVQLKQQYKCQRAVGIHKESLDVLNNENIRSVTKSN